jgi:hypothetical protein
LRHSIFKNERQPDNAADQIMQKLCQLASENKVSEFTDFVEECLTTCADLQSGIEETGKNKMRQTLVSGEMSHHYSIMSKCDRPLYRAAKEGHIEMIRLLLDMGVHPNGFTSLQPLIRPSDRDARATSVNTDDKPIIVAAENGHLPVVCLLAERGADILAYCRYAESAFTKAIDNHHIDTALFILSKIELRGEQDQFKKISTSVSVSRAYTEPGFRDGEEHWLPIHFAAASGSIPVMNKFIDLYGIDVLTWLALPSEKDAEAIARANLPDTHAMFAWFDTMRVEANLRHGIR